MPDHRPKPSLRLPYVTGSSGHFQSSEFPQKVISVRPYICSISAVEWPMRLIQAGDYRVVISAVERSTPHIITSPFIDFHVKRKPVVESQRILPIAFGVPLVLGVLILWRIRKRA